MGKRRATFILSFILVFVVTLVAQGKFRGSDSAMASDVKTTPSIVQEGEGMPIRVPQLTVTPTPEVTPTSQPTPGISATPTPTVTSVVSPTPTLIPSITPTTQPTLTPTVTPTPIISATPTPTVTPTPTPVPEEPKSIDLLTIEGARCNAIEVKISDTNEYRYEYEKSLYIVEVSEKENVYIKVSGKQGVEPNYKEKVKIYIPKALNFKKLKVISHSAGIDIAEMNKPIEVTDNSGAIVLHVPNNISNDISYTGTSGAAVIIIKKQLKDSGYTFSLKQKDSGVSLPSEFKGYIQMSESYKYVEGTGSANITVDIVNGALSVIYE